MGRARRQITEAQLRLATMEWTLATVKPDGRVSGKDGWVYGEDMDDGSQDTLLRLEGRKVWVGTDPLDRSKPALVWDPATDRIVMDGVHAVIRGAFDDAEGARRSNRRKVNVRKKTKRIREVDEKAAIAQLEGIYADLVEPDLTPTRLVTAHFKQPIRPARDGTAAGEIAVLPKRKTWITEEMEHNAALAEGRARQ